MCAAISLGVVVIPSTALSRPENDLRLSIHLHLTPETTTQLRKADEGVVISATYYGDPKPEYKRFADQIGQIPLGTERHVVEPGVGSIQVSGSVVDRKKRRWLTARGVSVNVNVYSARRSGPDNILDCTIFDDTVRKAAGGISIRCGLLKTRS